MPHRARTWARFIGQRETGIAALHITIVDIGFWRRRRPAIWHIGLHNAKMSHARRCSAPDTNRYQGSLVVAFSRMRRIDEWPEPSILFSSRFHRLETPTS